MTSPFCTILENDELKFSVCFKKGIGDENGGKGWGEMGWEFGFLPNLPTSTRTLVTRHFSSDTNALTSALDGASLHIQHMVLPAWPSFLKSLRVM